MARELSALSQGDLRWSPERTAHDGSGLGHRDIGDSFFSGTAERSRVLDSPTRINVQGDGDRRWQCSAGQGRLGYINGPSIGWSLYFAMISVHEKSPQVYRVKTTES